MGMTAMNRAAGVGALLAAAQGLAAGAARADGPCVAQCYVGATTVPIYELVGRSAVIAPPRVVSVVAPALYTVIAAPAIVRPEHVVAHAMPAAYATFPEQVLAAPAERRWTVRYDYHGREAAGWEDVPARIETRQRTIVLRPAHVMLQTIPAITELRPYRVLVSPQIVEHRVLPELAIARRRHLGRFR